MITESIDKQELIKRLDKKAEELHNLGFEATYVLLQKASQLLKGEFDNKFTAIYTESWIAGIHQRTITKMKRIEQQTNETVEQMLEREDVADNLVFLFRGHSQMQGE